LIVSTALAPLLPAGVVLASSATLPGGIVLDGWGGLHTFGSASVDTSNAPYWQGWDIARSFVVTSVALSESPTNCTGFAYRG
jgi:hypothetical protein